MTPETRRRVEANIFPAALPAIEDWESFPWHRDQNGRCDTDVPHSSQALAISVFGTMKAAKPEDADRALDALAGSVGLPTGGPWTVGLEWRDAENRLKETRAQTQVDAVAFSTRAVILFECKFTESDGGSCSQVGTLGKGSNQGKVQCDGNYRLQANPVNKQRARCALTGKGIRYWELIPKVLGFDADRDHAPCPFAGPSFQWMRNLALCLETATAKSCRGAVVVVYADSPQLVFPAHLRGQAWGDFVSRVRHDAVQLSSLSYQALVERSRIAIAKGGGDEKTWQRLQGWVSTRIATVSADSERARGTSERE
jgi:hypothetical protein